ncbi:hypothetical protein OGAPHI_004781 [Ogataea philodendri]|uniref:Uncharacterized protein n=1 Tax=Ogataea philodendri TaxID=1378263 RepID=A0A9P8P2M3_9ASCO|nr:uncharacterized protein OGAPHI_004781 [Ogataea philodendri]KAH3664067.1 hypothetical protein OGAPHI_004781 [Ogataea philodendri]
MRPGNNSGSYELKVPCAFESSSDLAPVTTILPDAKISAVVLGSLIRIITAAKRFGLYSALRACSAIVFSSKRQSRFTVATMFCNVGTIPEAAASSAIWSSMSKTFSSGSFLRMSYLSVSCCSSLTMSVGTIGKANEPCAVKALALAAVVGSFNESIFTTVIYLYYNSSSYKSIAPGKRCSIK